MRTRTLVLTLALAGGAAVPTAGRSVAASDPSGDVGAALEPVPFTDVRIDDGFWSKRIETNRTSTIPACFRKCEETGRIDNFAKAAGLMDGAFRGIYFDDSDVFKVIEGASYSLAAHPDPQLDAYLDDLLATIAAAQEPDGYLNTYHTLVAPDKKWTDINRMHELYCAGHLFEAAVAHYRATGKRTLLDVALRLADHIDSVFGPGRRTDPPGHEEIEIGLVKLFGETGNPRYLDLAVFFIEQRGRADGRELYGPYAQDHLPVMAQTEPVGHAVRAMYLYCGMADVAACPHRELRSTAYRVTLRQIWDDLVKRRLALTGGVGAQRHGEAFGEPYSLPNADAYNETCAAIGNAMWNHRMMLLEGDAKYADVLERVLYNGLLSGVSLEGDRFFYPNPLASHGSYHRSPWFSCSCCPVNIARFMASIPGYVYAAGDDSIWVNLYVQSEAHVALPQLEVTVAQTTRYPWDGMIQIRVDPEREATFDLRLRYPGWARNAPVPTDLYSYVNVKKASLDPIPVLVNGERARGVSLDKGYLVIRRRWQAGDVVKFDLPMSVRLVRAHERVETDRDRVAIERGPIVYCVEATDHGGTVRDLWLDEGVVLNTEPSPDLGNIIVVTGPAHARRHPSDDEPPRDEPVALRAIPYYAWDHRDPGEMRVWIPTTPELAEAIPPPTIASRSSPSASHCFEHDTVLALNDRFVPERSADHSIPRHTWWDHLGTTEWVQYDLPEPREISGADVYWFDDTGIGRCRLPASWRVLYRVPGENGAAWVPVNGASDYTVEPDAFNRVQFEPVKTDGVRIEVRLAEGFSGGILEWRIR